MPENRAHAAFGQKFEDFAMNETEKIQKERKGSFGGSIDLTQGPVVTVFFKYAAPILLMSLLSQLYSAADSIVLGQFAGKLAFSSVGAATPIISLIVNAVISINVGVSVLTARAFGARDDLTTKRIVGTAFVFALSLGTLLCLVGELLAPYLLLWSNVPEEVYSGSLLYLRFYLVGTPAALYYYILSPLLSARGDSTRPLLYMTASGITNVALNVILVAGFSLDVMGVSIATVASMYLSAILLTVRLVRQDGAAKLIISKIVVDLSLLKKILILGIPAVISSVTFSLTNLQIQSAINTFGQDGISGNAAGTQIDIFVFSVFNSLSAALATAIGQNLGAGKMKRISEIRRSIYLIAGITITVVSWSIIFLSEPLLSIFIPGEPEAIAFGKSRLFFIMSLIVLYLLSAMNGATMQAFGKTGIQMILNLICVCGLRLFWMLFIYPLNPTRVMLYIAYPIAYVLLIFATTVASRLVVRNYKRANGL